MDSWKFDESPEPYELKYRDAKYAVVMIMGGDDKKLGGALHPDLYEMTQAVGEDFAALVLVDFPEPEEDEENPKTSRVLEVLPSSTKTVEFLPEVNTGDPRPLADFLARALVSFSEETRIAIGFWGHGSGVFGDYDLEEVVLSREIRFGPLGAAVTEAKPAERVLVNKEVLSRSMLPDATSENALTNREASSALAAAFSRAGRTEPVEMLFFDTCMNASVEVFTELRRFAKTFVASSLLVPGSGWDYDLWMKATRYKNPASAEEWAFLSAGVFGETYDQRVYRKEAQMGAFSTSMELDFVGRFGELVAELRKHGKAGVELAVYAAERADTTVYDENVDLGHLVMRIQESTKDEGIQKAAARFCEAYEKALLGLSMAPAARENLTGMTVWCPLQGDVYGVSRYYEGLEFERVTGWLDFIRIAARSAEKPDAPLFCMYGFWGLELLEARSVGQMTFSRDPEVKRILLDIPEMSREFAGGLVEGDYAFEFTGAICFRNYIGLREFVRKLMEIREGDEFEALRECWKPGWVIGGSCCKALFSELEKYQKAFMETYAGEPDAVVYPRMLSALKKIGDDGVLVFYPMGPEARE
ncbi:MAG: hypothetical protein KC800_00475 [Candidatus Eremiobacteraeota bacterium]|nr:hypothetical protein [Candidatus Eremiobacteraeota bacterium]